jgi:hypothetical protein
MSQTKRSGGFDSVLLDELAQIAAARGTDMAAAPPETPAPANDAELRQREVIAAQREAIAAVRDAAQAHAADADACALAQSMRLAGLAFSGGGIRSATFNLGVLQALCEK